MYEVFLKAGKIISLRFFFFIKTACQIFWIVSGILKKLKYEKFIKLLPIFDKLWYNSISV